MAVRIEGRVRIGGSAAAGAVVRLTDANGQPADLICDREGAFSVPEALPGPYEVWVPAHRFQKSLTVPRVPIYRYELQLRSASGLSGRVVDRESGQPLAGARLVCLGADGEILDSVLTAANGRFETGEYAQQVAELEVEAPGYVGVRVAPGAATEIRLSRAASLEGQLVTSEGRVVSRMEIDILLSPMAGGAGPVVRRTACTNLHGRFLLSGLPSGRYRVLLAASGQGIEQEVVLRPACTERHLWILRHP